MRPEAPRKTLRHIVFVLKDISTIGGIPNRTRVVLGHAGGRDVAFHAITETNEFDKRMDGVHSLADDPALLRAKLAEWTPEDTVFVISNNTLKPFPPDIRARVQEFPIVFFSAGQMAFFIQTSRVLLDLDYVDSLRAMRIVSLSQADIAFQRQLGIFGQVRGTVPVAQRAENTYDPARNRRLGYVGRIEFHAKDCMKLLDVARAIQGSPLLPIQIFTTDGRNSPRFVEFRAAIAAQGLEEAFAFTVNCTDKDRIFREIAYLLLPSRMEGFGNVVVEAFSYGIPVIAASYAPGPAETIQHGVSGFLLDPYDGPSVRAALEGLTPQARTAMSQAAFGRHRLYSVEAHLAFLEEVCRDSLAAFEGTNLYPVFPRLAMAEAANEWRKTRPIRRSLPYRAARWVYRRGRRLLDR